MNSVKNESKNWIKHALSAWLKNRATMATSGNQTNLRKKTCSSSGTTNIHEITFFGLLTSSLMRGIHIGEISKLGWLIGLDEHAI